MAFVVEAAARECLLRFERFEAVVRALHDAGVPFIVDGAWALEHGAWFLDPAYDAPLFWKGHLVIPRQHKAVYETFVALASIGYEPRPATSPEDLAAWEQPERWNDGDPDQPELVPLQAFVNPEHPTATIRLAAESSEHFEEDWDAAEVQEVAPGMPVLALNPAEEGTIECEGPQRMWLVRFFDEVIKEIERIAAEQVRKMGEAAEQIRTTTEAEGGEGEG